VLEWDWQWELLAVLCALTEQALYFAPPCVDEPDGLDAAGVGVNLKPAFKGRTGWHASAPLGQLTIPAGRAAQMLSIALNVPTLLSFEL
jgi:hypothetical protein